MNSRIIANGILRAIAVVSGIVLLAYFLFKIQAVLAYLAIASVVSLLGNPIVSLLQQKARIPNTPAVFLTLMSMLGLFLGILALFVPLISEQSKNLSLLDIETLKADINTLYLQVLDYFGFTAGEVTQWIEGDLLENLDLAFIPNALNAFVSLLSNFSIGLFSVLFISFFFLKDSNLLQQGLMTFVPNSQEGKLGKSLEKIKGLLSRYFAGLLLQITILFIIYAIVLLLLEVEYAIIIALLCALFNLVPYLGPLIGGSIMLIFTMTNFVGEDFSLVILPKTLYVLVGLLIGQLIDNFFSQPFIFSNSVKSHPLEIFLVIIIAGLLFGVVGMVIAVPGYTTLKVILKEFLAGNAVVEKLTKNL